MQKIIAKKRTETLSLEGYISARNRLSPDHPIQPVLLAKQASLVAGIKGEERVEEIFRKHSFPIEHHIFSDLHLTSDGKFQIDILFLSHCFAIVFEVKNIGGTLEFRDNPPQLIRTRENGQKDGFESPVVQLERNVDLLNAWLKCRNINIPIHRAVVLAYPKQIVEVPPAKTTLLFPNLIPSFIRSLPKYDNKLVKGTFNWLSSELINNHQPYIPSPICETYNIPVSDLKKGVICEACGSIGMIKIPRTWYCPNCNVKNYMGYQKTLGEWFLLVKRSITNKECRDFLQIKDIYTANRILQSMNFRSEGTFRNRIYLMDYNNNHFGFRK